MSKARTASQNKKIAQVKALNIPGVRITHADNTVHVWDRPNTREVTMQLKKLGFHNHRVIGLPPNTRPCNYSTWQVPEKERV